MATAVLGVPDISCEHCEAVVTTAPMRLPGVHSVAVDIPAKQGASPTTNRSPRSSACRQFCVTRSTRSRP